MKLRFRDTYSHLLLVALSVFPACASSSAQGISIYRPEKEVAPSLHQGPNLRRAELLCNAEAKRLSSEVWSDGYTDIGTSTVIFRKYERYTYGCTPATENKTSGYWRSLKGYEVRIFGVKPSLDECKFERYPNDRRAYITALTYAKQLYSASYTLSEGIGDPKTPVGTTRAILLQGDILAVPPAELNEDGHPVKFAYRTEASKEQNGLVVVAYRGSVNGSSCFTGPSLCLNGTVSDGSTTLCREPNVQYLQGERILLSNEGFKKSPLSYAMSPEDFALRCSIGPNYSNPPGCDEAIAAHMRKPTSERDSYGNSNLPLFAQ
jgi:hypothetical protein